MVSFVFLYPAAVRNFLSWKVFLRINTDEHTFPSLLPLAGTLLAGTKLLRLITAHTLPYINPHTRVPYEYFLVGFLKMGPIGCP
jgi:hypothetical protein